MTNWDSGGRERERGREIDRQRERGAGIEREREREREREWEREREEYWLIKNFANLFVLVLTRLVMVLLDSGRAWGITSQNTFT